MKKTSVLFLLILIVSLSASCAKKTEYRSDVSMDDISAAVETSLDSGSLTPMEEAYLKGAMKLDTSLFDAYVVKINAYGVNIDEYGIFKAPTKADVVSVQKAVEDYLKLRLDTWMDEYMPEEKPKLEAARVKTCGLYVMYAILSDTQRDAAYTGFENALKAD
jgi:hypothetical protein